MINTARRRDDDTIVDIPNRRRHFQLDFLFRSLHRHVWIGGGGLSPVRYLGMTELIAGVALLITSLEGRALTPALLGRAAQMNRVAIFAPGLLFWSWMWGISGTLLAVPMMMVVKVICDHVEDLQPVADFLSE